MEKHEKCISGSTCELIEQSSINLLYEILKINFNGDYCSSHYKELINVCLWKYSEACGVKNHKFWSKKAKKLYLKNKSRTGLIFDHSIPRKLITGYLIANKDSIIKKELSDFLSKVNVGVFITKEENNKFKTKKIEASLVNGAVLDNGNWKKIDFKSRYNHVEIPLDF